MNLQQIVIQASFELYERQTHISSFLLLIVLFCSSIIGIGRINNPQFFSILGRAFFRFKTKENSLGEVNRLSALANFGLMLNFVIAITLCFFLLFFNGSNILSSVYLALALSFIYILIHQIGFRLASIFSGQSVIKENISLITSQIWFFGGVIFLVLALFWVLNMRMSLFFSVVFLLLLSLFTLVRIVKGLLFAYRHRISWYYIFLYICSLEVLPLFTIYRFLKMYLKIEL